MLTLFTADCAENTFVSYVASLNADGTTRSGTTNTIGTSVTTVDGNLYTGTDCYITSSICFDFDSATTGTT